MSEILATVATPEQADAAEAFEFVTCSTGGPRYAEGLVRERANRLVFAAGEKRGVGWQDDLAGGRVVLSHREHVSGGTNAAEFELDPQTGPVEVLVTWTPSDDRTCQAVYEVFDAGVCIRRVALDQRVPPEPGGRSLGIVRATGQVTIRLVAQPDGSVSAGSVTARWRGR